MIFRYVFSSFRDDVRPRGVKRENRVLPHGVNSLDTHSVPKGEAGTQKASLPVGSCIIETPHHALLPLRFAMDWGMTFGFFGRALARWMGVPPIAQYNPESLAFTRRPRAAPRRVCVLGHPILRGGVFLLTIVPASGRATCCLCEQIWSPFR